MSSIDWNDVDVLFSTDSHQYPSPNKISLPLSLQDIHLDFLRPMLGDDCKKVIFKLRSGQPLLVNKNSSVLNYEYGAKQYKVARFSKKFIHSLSNYRQKGYEIKHAQVRFIIAWKGKEASTEIPAVLPIVSLEKSTSHR